MENKEKRNAYYEKEIIDDVVYLMNKFYFGYMGKIDIVQLKENSKWYIVLEHFLRPEIERISNAYSYSSKFAITPIFKEDTLEDLFLQVRYYRFTDIPPKPIKCPELIEAYERMCKSFLKDMHKEFDRHLFTYEFVC